MLIAVALGAILAPLNSTMIAVALPQIIDDFDTDLETAAWLVTGYLIVLAALQPVTGKLGDRLGRRRLMLVGLVAFAAVSLGASLAPSLGVLIVFRLLQAVTIALTLPNYVAFLRAVLPADRRAAGFGMLGSAIGIAAGLGPLLGGLAIAAADWRAIFYVNVPLVALALLMAWRVVPERGAKPERSPFDLLGSILVSVVLVGAGLLILQGRQSLAAPAIALIVVALAALAGLLMRHELAHPDPVINPRLFRNRAFTAATSGVSLSNLSFYTLLVALPIVLAANLDWSGARIGLALTLLSGPTIVFATIGGRLADRFGRRAPAVAGLVVATVALVPLAVLGLDNVAAMLASIAVAGAGFGLALASHQTAAVESVPPAEAGAASGLFSTGRYLGSIVGSVVLAVALVTTTDGTTGFQAVAAITAVAALLAAIVSLGLPGRKATMARVAAAE